MFKKLYFYIVGTIFLVAVIFSGVVILYKEWRSGYVIWNQITYYPVNLLALELKKMAESVFRPILGDKEPGLPQVRLYISEKNQNSLMKDLPSNIKTWQKAHMIYPEGVLHPVQVRHRGDNPANWAYDKKSWRLKTRKKHLIDRRRVFNYVTPQEPNYIDNYVAYNIARRINIFSPESRLVELYINESSYGIYNEVEHLDEDFLRNHGLMPVNLYKGEQTNVEKKMGINPYLFGNPRLWSKTAVFNQVAEDDFSDLSYFLELLRKAETSDSAFSRLKNVARFEDWAKYFAFETLVQSWHSTEGGNMRLILDPWQGSVKPVSMDTLIQYCGMYPCTEQRNKWIFDNSAHSLSSLYHGSSDFILSKYQHLYKFAKEGVLLKMVDHIKELLPELEKTYSRDRFRFQRLFTLEHLARPEHFPYSRKLVTDEGMKAEWMRLLKNMERLQKWLVSQLEANPKVHWVEKAGQISLIIDGPVPVKQFSLKLSRNSPKPHKLVWDQDGDGKMSKQDMQLPFNIQENRIIINSAWTANRVTKNINSNNPYPFFGQLFSVPTQFNLISDTPLFLEAVNAYNALTDKSFPVSEKKIQGNTPRNKNRPVIVKSSLPSLVWSSRVEIKKVKVIENPVQVLPGTTIYMHPGASLVFRNRVFIKGTQNSPVKILSAIPNQIWGVVALHGPQTEGSVINHLHIEYGSGAMVENVRYIGMLSIHEARNVKLSHIHLRQNHKFDDMMHVVYSKDVTLTDCNLENAFSDALDVDISSIRISNCEIINAKNDAVDLMNSTALIESSELVGSGDKGVSVGESSELLIFNSLIKNNTIGVETKDASTAYLINVDMLGNNRQMNAYSKNWRYGTGGSILASKSFFMTSKNPIASKNDSKISIFDSTFQAGFLKKNNQVYLDKLSNAGNHRMARSNSYNKIFSEILNKWGIIGQSNRRGVFE